MGSQLDSPAGGRAANGDPARRELPYLVHEGGPSVRRRFNDAVLNADYIKEQRIGRADSSEVFAPLFSRPTSNKALKVEVGGIEPPSPGDRSGLLRAQPAVDLTSRLPPAEDLSASPGSMSGGGPRAEPPP